MSIGSLYGPSSWAPPAVDVVVVVAGADVVVDAAAAAVVDVEVLEVVVLDGVVELDVVWAAAGRPVRGGRVRQRSAAAYQRRRGRVLTRSSVARLPPAMPSFVGGFRVVRRDHPPGRQPERAGHDAFRHGGLRSAGVSDQSQNAVSYRLDEGGG